MRTFDDLYETEDTFEEVYAAIVEELVAAAGAGPVVYAVPGSPSVAERTVELLRTDDRVEITLVPALSFLDLAWAALGIDPLARGVRLVDAADFERVAGEEDGPFLVAQAWSRQLLSDVKLSLGEPGEGVPAATRAAASSGVGGRAGAPGGLVGARPHDRARPPHLDLRPCASGRGERRPRWHAWTH